MPTAFVGVQRQQQMLGTILEEEWMDEELFSGAQNEEQRRPWHKKQQKANFGAKKTKGGGGKEGGRVGKMVDWWMGRGDQWPNEAEEEEGEKRDKQQMVTLAKTTIQLSPSWERDGTKMAENGMDRDTTQKFNISNNTNSCTMPTPFIVGKSRTIPLKNGWNTTKAIEKTDQSKSEDRGNEVSVSLQVVREHNVTISASCCFGGVAEKKFPPLFATTTAHRGMPLSFCKNEKGSKSGNRTPMGAEVRANGAAGDVVRKLELRMVDIELEEGEDEEDGMEEEKRKWRRREWHDGMSGKRSRQEEEDKGGAAPTAAQPKQTTTGWTQFKRNREQQQRERREDGVFLPIRRLCPPQKYSSPYSSPTFVPFPPNCSTAQSAVATNFARANSALPLLSPLCSPQTAPLWLNISNGSSSGVGSSVSSVSPKSTDGEGERDNGKNNGHKMEQFQQQFRRTTNSWTSRRPHCTPCGGTAAASADYRVISLDMRPEPGRLDDFVPEVERERSKKAMDRTIGEFDNCTDTIKAKKTTTGEYGQEITANRVETLESAASFTNAKTVVRENRNYDLQSVDCWRRWSSLRRMPTTANAAKGGGGGTLPAKKREAKRTEESQNDGEEEDEALRRDEWGRLIVDRREWRQFLAEQRTPSSRRVESRIRLLDACNDSNNNSETDDGLEQYRKIGTRKKPMVVVLDGGGKEGQQQQKLAYDEDKKLLRSATMNNDNCNGNGRTTTTALLMRMKKENGDKKWRQRKEDEEIWEG